MTKIYFILLYKTLAKCTNPVRLLSWKHILWNLAFGFNHNTSISQVVSCIITELLQLNQVKRTPQDELTI